MAPRVTPSTRCSTQVRLLKLHYWTQIEHVRSGDGEEAWTAAAEMVSATACFSGTSPEAVGKSGKSRMNLPSIQHRGKWRRRRRCCALIEHSGQPMSGLPEQPQP